MSESPSPLRASVSRDETGAITELIDTAGASTLKRQLAKTTKWWRDQIRSSAVAIGVTDCLGTRAAVARTDVSAPVETIFIEQCHIGETSLKDQITAGLDGTAESIWIPLADAGQVIGGIAYIPSPDHEDPPPSLWANVTSRLLAQARRREQDLLRRKVAALGQFAAGAGHEIHNPLATIVGRSELLLRGETDIAKRQSLATIGAQALRVRDMIGDLRLFAHPPVPEPETIRFLSVIEAVQSRLSQQLEQREIDLHIAVEQSLEALADPVQLAVVFSELLRNSIEAIDHNGVISIDAQLVVERPFIEIVVSNNGPRLTAEEVEHLFDPFYSARQAGRGLGFGLCKCWRILEQHGGCIHAESNDTETTFRLHWPTAAAE